MRLYGLVGDLVKGFPRRWSSEITEHIDMHGISYLMLTQWFITFRPAV